MGSWLPGISLVFAAACLLLAAHALAGKWTVLCDSNCGAHGTAVSCVSKELCFMGSAYAPGSGIFRFDGSKLNPTFTLISDVNPQTSFLAISAKGPPSAPKVVAAGFGKGNVQYLSSDGKFKPAQNATVFSSISVASSPDRGQWVMIADRSRCNTIFVSSDFGESFSSVTVPAELLPHQACVNTVASVSASTWYVGAGNDPNLNNSPYAAIILKTSDFGQSFQRVYSSTGSCKITGLACKVGEELCVASAFGDQSGGTVIRVTNDDAAVSFRLPNGPKHLVTLANVAWSDADTVWLTGAVTTGTEFGRSRVLLYQSFDSGKTWISGAAGVGEDYVDTAGGLTFLTDGTGFATLVYMPSNMSSRVAVARFDP